MLYSDGRLRAHHSYHTSRIVPGVGLVICRATAAWFVPGGSDTRRAWVIDQTTGEITERCNWNSFTQMGNGEGAVDYDSTRDCLWSLGCATSTWVQITSLASATWTATKRGVWDNWLKTSGVIRYVASADRIAMFPTNFGSGFGVFDPSTYTAVYPTLTGSFSLGFVAPDGSVQQPGCGMEWCAALGGFLLWNNSSLTTEISTLTPSNPADWSQPWARGVLSVAAGNSVTPPATIASGVFGRMTYSPGLGAILLHVQPTQPIYAVMPEPQILNA